jgi:hypothetical protein
LAEYKIARVRDTKIYRNARKLLETKLANEVENSPKSFYIKVRLKINVKDDVGLIRAKGGNRDAVFVLFCYLNI